jgi:hypothetical protein
MKLRTVRWAGHVERTGRGEVHTGFWWGKMKKRVHLEDLRTEGRLIRMDPQETGWGIVELIDLDQDRDKWKIVVKTVLNLSVL